MQEKSWIGLPRTWTSTLLDQCGIIVTENSTKGRNVQRRGLNVFLEGWTTQDICLRVHIVLKNEWS